MSDSPDTIPTPGREPPRQTDGEVLFTVTVKKKQLLALIGIVSAVASPGIAAFSKSCNAEDKADQVQALATVATQTTDVEADAAYKVWRKESAANRADIAAVADKVNRLIDKVDIQEAALAGVLSKPDRARFRQRTGAKPTPKVELAVKPPPPPTPEAAAAAVAPPPGVKPP